MRRFLEGSLFALPEFPDLILVRTILAGNNKFGLVLAHSLRK